MTHVEALLVQSDSDCPSAEAVQAEVRELTTPEQRRAVPADARAVISDRGDSIAIAVTRDGKTRVRVYRDAARDCSRRGHFVSVLVVVSLMPPDLGSDPDAASIEADAAAPSAEPPTSEAHAEPEPEAAPEPHEAPAAPSPPKRVWVELAARAQASTPISDSARIASFGGAFGVALGAEKLRFTLGVSYQPKSELRYTGRFAGRADLEQQELAAGVRLALGHAPVDTSFDAALLLSRASVSGSAARQPARAHALSAGLRAGFHVCWSEQSRLSPFVGAHAALFPFAPELTQLPQGTVGHLPYLWVGLSGGLSLAL